MKTLLVISTEKENYLALFKDIKTIPVWNYDKQQLEDEELNVDQACWEDVNLTSYCEEKGPTAIVDIRPARIPLHGSRQSEFRTLRVDFLLVRNIINGIPPNDFKNLIYGFYHANIPCVNSLQSLIDNFERPIMYGALESIVLRLGRDKFPLIPQTYYPNHREMRFTPAYPIVIKVGHTHGGWGKMVLRNQEDFNDLASILALHEDYCTAEPFLTGEYDIRIQKIGKHYRAYKRVGATWKTNTSGLVLEDLLMTDRYKMWADECSKLFGGMDILAVDVIRAENGTEHILEVNDCAIGLGPQHEEEDVILIRDLVVEKMKEWFGKPDPNSPAAKAGGAPATKPRSLSRTSSSRSFGNSSDSNSATDSSSLFKKLEVELINTENAKMELAQELKQTKSKVAYLEESQKAWKSYTTKYFVKLFGAGIFVGFSLGLAIAFAGVKLLKYKRG